MNLILDKFQNSFSFLCNFDLVISFFQKKPRPFLTTNVQIITLKPEKCVKLALFQSVFHGFCSYNPLKWLQLLWLKFL